MRLIDADATVEKLKEYVTEMENDIYYGSNLGIPEDCICEAIEEVPTIEAEPVRQWIPCSERIPEPDTYVLALLHDGEMCVVKLYDDGCWIGCRGFAPSEAVTYWMPLPEPPKEFEQCESD